jgi:hypothetical protein
MKRVVTGFILSLFLFLCAGYTQVYAGSFGNGAFFTPDEVVQASLPGTDKISHSIDATAIEEEDDQPTSSKKYLDSSPVTIHTYPSSATVQDLSSGKSYANTLCSRSYILLRVFRI